jgi:23S rRNA (pseudouridine1915-N3)-methyltransferase
MSFATGNLGCPDSHIGTSGHSKRVKVFVYYIGKARDEHANGIAAEFMKRSSRYAECVMREIVPQRFDLFAKHPAARKIFLDPAGRAMDSGRFIRIVEQAENEGQDLVFLIGGHDGLPAEWKPRADLLLSLSSMTFPHELARAMLAEQIYRAFTTLRGHPYPR